MYYQLIKTHQKLNIMEIFNSGLAKEKIEDIFQKVSFRKFGNAFRKHIDFTFAREYNLKKHDGLVCKDMTWQEAASYQIADGNYYINEEKFNSFMQEFK